MADQPITGLTALTSADQADVYPIVDVSVDETKKITQQNVEISIANSTNFVDEIVANSYFTTELAGDSNFLTTLTTNSTFQTAVNNFISSSGGSGNIQVDQTPQGTGTTYGVLTGLVNSSNKTFVVSKSVYTAGKLQVYLNGTLLVQGSDKDWVETNKATGTFDFIVAPTTGDEVTVVYDTSINSETVINLTAGQDLVAGNPVGVSFLDDNTVAIANTTYLEQAFGATPDSMLTIQIATDKIAILYRSGANLAVRVGTIDRDTMLFTFGSAVNINTDTPTAYDIQKLDTNKFAVIYNTATDDDQVRLVGATVATNTITLGTSVLLLTATNPLTQGLIKCAQNGTDRGITFVSDNTSYQQVIAYTFAGTVPTAGGGVATDINGGGGGGIGATIAIAKIATDKFAVSGFSRAQVGTVATNTITMGTAVTFRSTTPGGSPYGVQKIISPTTDVFIIAILDVTNKTLWCATVSGTTPTFGSVFNGAQSFEFFVESATEIIDNGNYLITISGNTLTGAGQIYSYTPTGQIVDMLDGTFWDISSSGSNLVYFVRGMSQNFIGIVQSNVSQGGTASILIKGKDANQSGLIAGNKYDFVGTTLTFNPSGSVIALSATEIII